MRELLLASTSSARRSLLGALGVVFRAEAPGVDEDVVAGTPVEQAVAELSERKARAVLKRNPTTGIARRNYNLHPCVP